MGWGWIPSAASQVMDSPYIDNPPDNFSDQDFWRWVSESTDWNIASGSDNPLANSKAFAGRQRWHGGGLPAYFDTAATTTDRSEEHTSELQSLMRISYAVFCLKKKNNIKNIQYPHTHTTTC